MRWAWCSTRCVAGEKPPEVLELPDMGRWPTTFRAPVALATRPCLLRAVDAAMGIRPSERPNRSQIGSSMFGLSDDAADDEATRIMVQPPSVSR